jgi:hypothetical protein
MKEIGLLLISGCFLVSCNNNKPEEAKSDDSFQFNDFAQKFRSSTLPYSLPDSTLQNTADGDTLPAHLFASFVPDSVKTRLVGTGSKLRFVPLAHIGEKGKENYFIVKVLGKSRHAALAIAFDKDNSFGASIPFLIPDAEQNTTQVSTIDKALSITRNVSRKGKDDVVTEGKDVYAYNSAARSFTLIMTDLLDDTRAERINPIDTFARTHAFAGDYGTDKTNLVSIRDGKDENELNFYIHFERTESGCSGELKGTAFFTSSKTAVFRQGGEACVLEFTFGASSVTLKEAGGCGLYRGMKCVFDGNYKKKKVPKKSATA